MSKLFALGLTLMVLSALPSTAQPSATEPCPHRSGYTTVGAGGAHEDITETLTPAGPYAVVNDENPFDYDYNDASSIRFSYRIDVSGSPTAPAARAADVRIALRWDNESDYDIVAYDADGQLLAAPSEGFFSGGAEHLFIPQVATCTDLLIDVVNWWGLPTNEMTLDVALGDLE